MSTRIRPQCRRGFGHVPHREREAWRRSLDVPGGTCQDLWDSCACGVDKCFGSGLVDPGGGRQLRWFGSAMEKPAGFAAQAALRVTARWSGSRARVGHDRRTRRGPGRSARQLALGVNYIAVRVPLRAAATNTSTSSPHSGRTSLRWHPARLWRILPAS